MSYDMSDATFNVMSDDCHFQCNIRCQISGVICQSGQKDGEKDKQTNKLFYAKAY